MEIPTRLRWVFRGTNKPVLWVGAGVSCQAEPGLPTLWGLVNTLKRTQWPEGPEIEDPYAFIDAYLAEFKARGSLVSFLEASIRPDGRGATPGALHRALARLVAAGVFSAVIDTNYDLVLRRALEQVDAKFLPSRLSSGLELPSDGVPRYWTLHGDHTDWKATVLDGRSYATFADRHPMAIHELELFLRQRLVLFVGCSMQDPRIVEWLWALDEPARANLHGLVAVLDGRAKVELEEKAKSDPKYARLLDHLLIADLPGFTWLPKWFRSLADGHATQPGAASPPAQRVFVGRAEEFEQLRACALGGACAVAVLGMTGVGKSTLARQVLADGKVATHFGARRSFVSVAADDTAAGVLATVAGVMGLSGSPTQRAAAVASRMADGPILLVLDNLETAWHADGPQVDALLGSWASVPTLALVVTMRGKQWPSSALREPVRLETLAPKEARELFLGHAPRHADVGERLDDLLAELGGVPLGLELLGKLGQSVSLDVLRRAWAARRDALLPGWATALEMSYASPMMTTAVQELVGVVAELPNGLAGGDVEAVLGGDWAEGMMGATGLGLVDDRAGRVHVHALVREYVRREKPASGASLGRSRAHYVKLATALGPKVVGGSGGAEAAVRLTAEHHNAEAALLAALEEDDPLKAVEGCAALRNYGAATGADIRRPLRAAVDRATDLGETGWAAQCIETLGDIAFYRSEYDEAHSRYEQALAMFTALGAVLGQANCIQSLGDIALNRDEHDEARSRYEQALTMYKADNDNDNILGQANCIWGLGSIALDRNEHDEARSRYEQALTMYNDNILGQANCILGLGTIALNSNEHDEARSRNEQALTMYKALGDVVGQANCILGLGDIALNRNEHDGARSCYEQALTMYKALGDVVGQAKCIRGLGSIAAPEHPTD